MDGVNMIAAEFVIGGFIGMAALAICMKIESSTAKIVAAIDAAKERK